MYKQMYLFYFEDEISTKSDKIYWIMFYLISFHLSNEINAFDTIFLFI